MQTNEVEKQYTVEEAREIGGIIYNWMIFTDNSNCDVPCCTLSLSDLSKDVWEIHSWPETPNPPQKHLKLLEPLPELFEDPKASSLYEFKCFVKPSTGTQCCGVMGPGVLFLDVISRNRQAGDPSVTEIAARMYEESFSLWALRYLFICDINNKETKHIVDYQILPDLPDFERSKTFRPNTAIFFELLGTKLGRTAVRFVLGAYGQGRKCIGSITILVAPNGELEHLRFDIVDCSVPAGKSAVR